jgi:hypothetical protein
MALGSTEPLTEMSTRNLPGGKWRPARKADNIWNGTRKKKEGKGERERRRIIKMKDRKKKRRECRTGRERERKRRGEVTSRRQRKKENLLFMLHLTAFILKFTLRLRQKCLLT